MGNALGLIIREVDLQTIGNLLRRPAIDPFAVTTIRLVAADERSLPRPDDLAPLAKNTGQIVTLFALTNLWMARKKLLALQAYRHMNAIQIDIH